MNKKNFLICKLYKDMLNCFSNTFLCCSLSIASSEALIVEGSNSLREKKKSTKRKLVTDFPYRRMQELRLRKNMHKFIAVQDVYFTLVYMFSSSSVVSQLNYFSITQNLFSQPRTFFWREFLKAYRELKNLTFRGEINKLHVQIDFFAAFTTNRVDDDGITTMFAPYPCRLQIVPSLDSKFQLSTNVISEDTQITIIPEYVNVGKSRKNEDFRTKEEIGIDVNIKEGLVKMGKTPSSFLIKKIRTILTILRGSRFLKNEYTYSFLRFSVEDLCNDLNLIKLYDSGKMGRVRKTLGDILEFLNYHNIAVVFFDEPFKKQAFLIIEVNRTKLNEGSWFYNVQEPYSWSNSESHVIKSGLSVKEVLTIFEVFFDSKKIMYDYKKSESEIIKRLDRKNDLLLFTEKHQDPNNVRVEEKINDFISFEIVIAYTERTAVGFRNRLSIQGEKKMLLALIDFRKKSAFIPTFFKLFNGLEDFFSSKKDLNFNRRYVKFQKNFLLLVNNYFKTILQIIEEEGDPLVSEVKSYFKRKFIKEKRKKKSIESSDWFSMNYEFDFVFPVGYIFSFFKKREDGKKNSTFLLRFDRLEEERPKIKTDNLSHTAIISFPREFRKSFQANLANEFFSSKLYALDIDMISLHMNLMLCILGKQSTYLVEWNVIYNQFVQDLKKWVSDTFIKKNKIDRSFIKQFFLSLLNGRKLLDPNLFPNYGEEFKKIGEGTQAKKFFKCLHNFVKQSLLYRDCLEFQKKILSMETFMGISLEITINTSEENSMKERINIVLQYLESLLLSALFYDLLNEKCIIHSLERDGVVVFLSLEQIKSLKLPFFEKLSKDLFSSRVKLSFKLLVRKNESDKVKTFFSNG